MSKIVLISYSLVKSCFASSHAKGLKSTLFHTLGLLRCMFWCSIELSQAVKALASLFLLGKAVNTKICSDSYALPDLSVFSKYYTKCLFLFCFIISHNLLYHLLLLNLLTTRSSL